mmetsp:Transcript_19465/g.14145  ORF Transcript_19465/g.14145 Transcript_19465/m.14145 type:complete len:114 (+) Transcript_19465:2011-2352(+)
MMRESIAAGMQKIEEKKIKQELRVEVVSAKTIEALLKFLGIEPDDHRYVLDQKLNQHRIEIQGQKPTKIKKQLKPDKFENIKERVKEEKLEEEEEVRETELKEEDGGGEEVQQ